LPHHCKPNSVWQESQNGLAWYGGLEQELWSKLEPGHVGWSHAAICGLSHISPHIKPLVEISTHIYKYYSNKIIPQRLKLQKIL
jgi:hypothetical protein